MLMEHYLKCSPCPLAVLTYFFHLFELSKAVPVGQENDACSCVRGHLRPELLGTEIHLIC